MRSSQRLYLQGAYLYTQIWVNDCSQFVDQVELGTRISSEIIQRYGWNNTIQEKRKQTKKVNKNVKILINFKLFIY